MQPLTALSAAATSGKPPLRLIFVFVPGGVNVDAWLPKGEGADYQFSPTLEALKPVRENVLVLTGLNGRARETGGNGHPLGTAPWLSSAPINEKDRGGYCTDISVDQIAAQAIGRDTRLPSLELGCDRDSAEIHTSNISWRGPASPMGKEPNPRAVFNRLLGDPGTDIYQRSILDLVREDAARLRRKLGGVDRTKLDEYFDSVRAIEKRIEFAEKHARTHRPPEVKLPEAIPDSYAEHLGLLNELLALGLQTDSTRVATFMYNNEPGRRSWPEIGVNDDHHGLAHLDPRTAEGRDKLEKLHRIDRAYLAVLRRIPPAAQIDARRRGHVARQLHDRLRQRSRVGPAAQPREPPDPPRRWRRRHDSRRPPRQLPRPPARRFVPRVAGPRRRPARPHRRQHRAAFQTGRVSRRAPAGHHLRGCRQVKNLFPHRLPNFKIKSPCGCPKTPATQFQIRCACPETSSASVNPS